MLTIKAGPLSRMRRTPPVTRNRTHQSQNDFKNVTTIDDHPGGSRDVLKSTKKVKNKKPQQKPKDSGQQPDVNIYDSLPDDSDGSDIENLKLTNNQKKQKLIPYSQILLVHRLVNPKDTMKTIKSWVKGQIHFQVANEKRCILTYSKEDYEAVLKNLKDLKFEHFTYSPKELKPKKIVLTGLEAGYDKQEIEDDINDQLKGNKIKILSLQNIFTLVRCKTNNNRSKRDINKFLINFPGKCDMSHIMKNVKYVCDHKISWEPFINKYKSVQCRNCQRFGHAALNCGMKYRCVKCTTPHDVGQCQKKPEDFPQCVNCNEHHSANYSKCQSLIDFRNRTNLRKSTTNNEKLRISPRVRDDLSYKDAFIGDNNSFNYSDNSNFNFLSNEVKSLFNSSLPALLSNIKKFVPIYNLEKDELSKKMLILDFLSQYV